MMNVCVVGGGHIGTTLACYIKKVNPNYYVSLYTRKPEQFSEVIKCNDWEKGISFETTIDCISSDPSQAANLADIVYIALPHFAVEKAFYDIAQFVSDKAFIGVLPGSGGCEFFFNKYFKSTHTLFGFQRVPFTAKLENYGKETNLKSWKPYSVIGTMRPERINDACDIIESCGLKTKKAPNYLSVALVPSNPILHTSRTYELFRNYSRDEVFPNRCKFYVGWTDFTSTIMLTMDEELHCLLSQFTELDTSVIKPLRDHYESPTIHAMTEKINSITTFQTVYAPLKPIGNNEGYVADLQSRMFTEDFPWGLAIIRAYCEIVGTRAPMMDKVLSWYSDYMHLNWYVNGDFCGKDLIKTGIPQKYGIDTYQKLMSHYL